MIKNKLNKIVFVILFILILYNYKNNFILINKNLFKKHTKIENIFILITIFPFLKKRNNNNKKESNIWNI